MQRKSIVLWGIAVAILVFAQSTSAIVRVAPRWNFTEFYVQGGSPLGSYNGFPTQDFLLDGAVGLAEFDGSDLFESGLSLGLSIGQLRQGRFMYSVGFRYTNSEPTNQPLRYVRGSEEWTLVLSDVTLHQYDLDLNFNLFLLPLTRSAFSPYVGVGVSAGFTQVDWRDFQDEKLGECFPQSEFWCRNPIEQTGCVSKFLCSGVEQCLEYCCIRRPSPLSLFRWLN